MNITIDARLYGLENAGLGRYVMKLVEHLARIDKRNRYTLLLRKKYFDELALPPKWTKVLADFRHYSFAEQVQLPKMITATRPDLVHFPHFNIPVAYKGKYVCTIHDMLMHQMKGKDTTTLSLPAFLIKRLGYKYIFRRAVIGARRVLVPSNFIKKDLVAYYRIDPSQVAVTYEGVEVPNISESLNRRYSFEEKYFIYAGNSYPHKNLDRAVRAIISLNRNSSLKTLLLIASARGVFTERLEKLVGKLGAGEFVKLLGFVPDAELFALYRNSTGFLFPSLSEGFGLPGLEAIMSGTLAVVSDIPVFNEIYKEHALYFNPYDFSSITKALQEAVEMPREQRLQEIKSAQEFASRYSWEKMARETIKVYKEAAR